MNDNSEIFNKCIAILKNDIKLIIPFFISTISLFIFIFLFVFLIGFHTIFLEYNELSNQYDQLLLNQENENIPLTQTKDEYITENLDVQNIRDLFLNTKTYILGGLIIILWYLFSIFFINVGFYQNTKIIKNSNEKSDIFKSINESLIYFSKLIKIKITYWILIVLPLTLIIILLGLLYVIEFPIISIITLFIASIFLNLIWIIYISLKLIFIECSLYFENKTNIKEIIKYSFKITKNKIGNVIIIALIIYGISMIGNIGTQPLFSGIAEIMLNLNFLNLSIIIILLIIISIIQSIISCFSNLFLLNSYLNFKDNELN